MPNTEHHQARRAARSSASVGSRRLAAPEPRPLFDVVGSQAGTTIFRSSSAAALRERRGTVTPWSVVAPFLAEIAAAGGGKPPGSSAGIRGVTNGVDEPAEIGSIDGICGAAGGGAAGIGADVTGAEINGAEINGAGGSDAEINGAAESGAAESGAAGIGGSGRGGGGTLPAVAGCTVGKGAAPVIVPARGVPHDQQSGNDPITSSPHLGHFHAGCVTRAAGVILGMGNSTCIARSKSGWLTCTCTRPAGAPSAAGSGSTKVAGMPAVCSLPRISSASTVVRSAETVRNSSDITVV